MSYPHTRSLSKRHWLYASCQATKRSSKRNHTPAQEGGCPLARPPLGESLRSSMQSHISHFTGYRIQVPLVLV
jgi:hypothetical protein